MHCPRLPAGRVCWPAAAGGSRVFLPRECRSSRGIGCCVPKAKRNFAGWWWAPLTEARNAGSTATRCASAMGLCQPPKQPACSAPLSHLLLLAGAGCRIWIRRSARPSRSSTSRATGPALPVQQPHRFPVASPHWQPCVISVFPNPRWGISSHCAISDSLISASAMPWLP